ncbi:MAG: outer membrane beta-barrel family protein, partial [Paludibacter sp.]|nr:outer membrane beta-barrel family protein [Paludibacter sp.]
GEQKYLSNAILLSLSNKLFDGQIGYGAEYDFSQNDNSSSLIQENISTGIDNLSLVRQTQNLLAFYVDYKYNLDKFSFYAGLRIENISTKYSENNISSDSVKIKPTTLGPTLRITYDDKNLHLSGSYRRIITRPSYSSLNNFLFFESRFAYQQGNPYLQQSIQNFFSLNATVYDFNVTANYTKYTDAIAIVIYPYNNETGSILKRLENIPDYRKLDIGIVWQKSFGKYEPQLEFSFGKQWFDYAFNSTDKFNYNGFYYSAKLFNSIELPKNWNLDLDLFYNSKNIRFFSEYSHTFNYYFIVSKTINKFSIDLSFDNIFYPSKEITVRNMNNIYSRDWDKQDNAGISLTVTYRFNSIKARYTNNKSGTEAKRF